MLDRALGNARQSSDGVVVIVPADADWRAPAAVRSAPGGSTRSDSVRAGLELVPDDAECIVVHDAARPLASRALFRAVIAAVLDGADAAIPAVPVVDTVKRVTDDRVVATVPRTDLVLVQTPQAFRAGALRDAHRRGGVDTDDAALVEAAGGTVVVVPGEPRNVKLTVPGDLELAQALLDTGPER